MKLICLFLYYPSMSLCSYITFIVNLNAASLGAGTGKELHVPKNISDIAALTGMPAEQANRTVR